MRRILLVSAAAAAVIAILVFAPAPSPAARIREHAYRGEPVWRILLYPRFVLAALFAAAGAFLLATRRITPRGRLWALAGAAVVFGLAEPIVPGLFGARLGWHPSPVCAVMRPVIGTIQGRAVAPGFWVTLGFVGALTLAGNKLFCGWVCPIGALQELAHRIPLRPGAKRRIPFQTANAVRIALFIVFVIVALATGKLVYRAASPFGFLQWDMKAAGIVSLGVTLAVSLVLWRPFCHLVCPMGLVTWIVEQFSLLRVRRVQEGCNECGVCAKRSPCQAIPAIVQERRVRPDCFACGFCVDRCARSGLAYGRRKGR